MQGEGTRIRSAPPRIRLRASVGVPHQNTKKRVAHHNSATSSSENGPHRVSNRVYHCTSSAGRGRTCKTKKEKKRKTLFSFSLWFSTMSSTMATAQSVRLLSHHIFFAAASTRPAVSSGASPAILYGLKAAPRSWSTPTFGVRCMGTAAAAPGNADVASADAAHFASGPKKEKGVASYWGVDPPKVTRDDGSDWKWSCFKPGDTYSSDLSINLAKQHAPVTWMDKLARWTVKSLRWPTDVFFQRRYGCRAMMLETVAAVPGMVGGLLLHLHSLRRFEHSGGWIRALLEEAENERMHLMTFMEVSQPRWYERALVVAVQGVFFNAYFLGYLLSPKFAHRVVGYLEEEAIHSYTEFLKEIDAGNIDNVPAPPIAIDYWRLPPNSMLRDVVTVVRADEAHHRDVNHYASDIHVQGLQLKELPAPVGYH